MRQIHRQRRTIYVNEITFDTLKEAADFVGIPNSTLSKRLGCGEFFYKGFRIARTLPPRILEQQPQRELCVPRSGKRLLIFRPFGEGLLDMGLPEARR